MYNLIYDNKLKKIGILFEENNIAIFPFKDRISFTKTDDYTKIAEISEIKIENLKSENETIKKEVDLINKLGSDFYALVYRRDSKYVNFLDKVAQFKYGFIIIGDKAIERDLSENGVIPLSKEHSEEQEISIENKKVAFDSDDYRIVVELKDLLKLSNLTEDINFYPLVEKSDTSLHIYDLGNHLIENGNAKIRENKLIFNFNIKKAQKVDELKELEEPKNLEEIESEELEPEPETASISASGILDHNISHAKIRYELELLPHPVNQGSYLLRFRSFDPSGVLKNDKEVELKNDSHARLIIARYLSMKRPAVRKLFEMLKSEGKLTLETEQQISTKTQIIKTGSIKKVSFEAKPTVKVKTEEGIYVYIPTQFYDDKKEINYYQVDKIRSIIVNNYKKANDILDSIKFNKIKKFTILTNKKIANYEKGILKIFDRIEKPIINAILIMPERTDVIKFNKVAYSLYEKPEDILSLFENDYLKSIIKTKLLKNGFALVENHEITKKSLEKVGSIKSNGDIVEIEIKIPNAYQKYVSRSVNQTKAILDKYAVEFNWDEKYINSKIDLVLSEGEVDLYKLSNVNWEDYKEALFSSPITIQTKVAFEDEEINEALNVKELSANIPSDFINLITFIASHLIPVYKENEVDAETAKRILEKHKLSLGKNYKFYIVPLVKGLYLFDVLKINVSCDDEIIEKQIYVVDRPSASILIAINSKYDLTDKEDKRKLLKAIKEESNIVINVEGHIYTRDFTIDEISDLIQALASVFSKVNYNLTSKRIDVTSSFVINKNTFTIEHPQKEDTKIASDLFVRDYRIIVNNKEFNSSGLLPKVKYDLLALDKELPSKFEKTAVEIQPTKYGTFIIENDNIVGYILDKLANNTIKSEALVDRINGKYIVALEKEAAEIKEIDDLRAESVSILPTDLTTIPIFVNVSIPFSFGIPIQNFFEINERVPGGITSLYSITVPYEQLPEIADETKRMERQAPSLAEDIEQEEIMESQIIGSVLRGIGEPIISIDAFLEEMARENPVIDYKSPISTATTAYEKQQELGGFEDYQYLLMEQNEKYLQEQFLPVSPTPQMPQQEEEEQKQQKDKKKNKKKAFLKKADNVDYNITINKENSVFIIDHDGNNFRVIDIVNDFEKEIKTASEIKDYVNAFYNSAFYGFNNKPISLNINITPYSEIYLQDKTLIMKNASYYCEIEFENDIMAKSNKSTLFPKISTINPIKKEVEFKYKFANENGKLVLYKYAKIDEKLLKLDKYDLEENKIIKVADDIVPEEFNNIMSPNALQYIVDKINEHDPELAEILQKALAIEKDLLSYLEVLKEARNVLGLLIIKSDMEGLPVNKLTLKSAFSNLNSILERFGIV